MKHDEMKVTFAEAIISIFALLIAVFAASPKVRGATKDVCKKLNESDFVQNKKEKLGNGLDWLEEKIENLKETLQ